MKLIHLTVIIFLSVNFSYGAAPVISNLPATVSVIESQPAPPTDVLFTLDVTDGDNDTFTCGVQSTSPALSPAAFNINDNSGTFEFQLINNPPFDFDTTSVYAVTVACTDSNSEVGTGDITVNILKNTSPTISGLPTSVSVSETLAIGQKVYDVTVTDTESDSFTCVIDSQSPTADTFSINKPASAYEINLDKALDAATNPSHTVDIKCKDSWGFTTKPLTVSVTANTPPVFTGYPQSESALESAAGGTTVHTITVADSDSFSCSISPSPSTSAFSLDPATNDINLVTGHNLNYATQNTYTITITCTDAKGSSTATLTVNVQQNTRPVITPFSAQTVSESESAKRKLVDVTVTEADPYTCSIPTMTEFSIEPTGGSPAYAIYLNANPGLDFATTPSYSIVVTCSDDWGSDTETLTVSVQQNAPPTFTGLPASTTIVESDPGGRAVYTLTVTDTGDTFTCSGGSGPFMVQYDGTDWVVYLSSTHSLDADTTSTYTITVTCTDSASKSSTGSVTINVQSNSPPDIQNLPFTGTASDTETAQRLLHTLVVVDSESDAFSCNKSGSGPFSLLLDGSDWKLYLNANPNFSPPTPSYTLTITCADDWGSSSGTATININANASPTFSGMPATAQINEADAGGTSIYTVTVTDAESDAISCTIDDVIPNSATTAFTMVKPASDYQIELVAGHTLRQETTPQVVITIKCTDGSPVYGNLTITVQPNTPPDITSLPAAGTFVAGTTSKTKIHDLVVTDAENDAFICTLTPSPAGPFAFEYTGSAYEIYVSSNPTFTASTYDLAVTCQDDYGSSSNSFTLSVTPNTNPVITGMPVTVTVSETETASRVLHTIAVTDAESQTITCALISVPPGPFSINQDPSVPSYKVELDANAIDLLDAVTHPDHTVNVTCQDSSGGASSADLLVSVTPNNAPSITALPDHFEVSENQVVELEIWTLAYTDTENDVVTCNITTNPAGAPFDLRESGTPNEYKLWVQSNPNFNYTAVPSYQVTFTCTDTHSGRTGRSTSNTLTVDILENRPPVFTSTNTVTRNAQTTSVGTTIHTCATTDADLDIVTYTVSINPTTDSFDFNPVTCEIKAAKDLKEELTNFYTATITAFDGKATTIQSLGITLNNVNTAPVLTSTGLNQVTRVYFDETTPTDTLLYTPVVYDPDAGQTQSITYTVFPAGETDMFDVSTSAIKLKNGKTFDYEEISFYKLTMYVNDGYATTGPYYLEVHVQNIPEVCGFDKNIYEISTTEAGQGGGRMNIGFTISDEDDPDYHTFQLVNNPHSQYFDIGQYSGEITFKTNYDIDTCGFNHPRNATIIVQCTDKFGTTGTATVSIYVEDYNDNTPQFPGGGQVMIVTQYTQPGAFIGSLNATDCDYGLNADLEFSGASSTGSPYYTVAANGNVYLTNTIDFDYGTDHTFLVKAKDHGTPQLTGSTYLTIIYRWTSTTSTTTVVPSTPTDWWDKPENVALVAFLALLGLLLLSLLTYLLCLRQTPCSKPFNKCPSLKQCCKPKSPAKKIVTPKNPKKEPFKFFDHNDLNVQREMFSTKQQEGNTLVPMKL